MSTKQILVLGGGFAGLWSAVGAARKLDELGESAGAVEVTLVNRDPFHGIRVRNYEPDLSPVRVPLDDVLGPIGVRRVEGEVAEIDLTEHRVIVNSAEGQRALRYDRLVFALGSQLFRPPVAGLAEHAFDVDTYRGAARLDEHLRSLTDRPEFAGQFTVVVVGAGLTGIETACEMPARLRAIAARAGTAGPCRVLLVDRNRVVGSDMGESARPVIEEALSSLGVETRLGVDVTSITPGGISFSSGEIIPTATVVWCTGMRANPLTRLFPIEPDPFGRISVDEFLRVRGIPDVFAAGDVARAQVDDRHLSVMSCQHGRPMGRFAGHNVVCDLLGLPMAPLHIDWYVTILDLGPWGAVYTEGWDRHVVAKGETAKKTKQQINGQRIYPPLNRNRGEILAAAAPTIQKPPPIDR
jgi:NADH dehydrogenase